MYYYIYDSFLAQPKFSKLLGQIESRLAAIGLNGPVARLSPLKNLKELIGDQMKRGVTTIVVVGNDNTVGQVVNVIGNFDVVLGIIPIGKPNNIAELLGIPQGDEACDILSARMIGKLDLGKANNYYFLSSAHVESTEAEMEFEGPYSVKPMVRGCGITIYNLLPLNTTALHAPVGAFSPHDGLLDATVARPARMFEKFRGSNQIYPDSVIATNRVTLRASESVAVTIDGNIKLKTPLTIEVMPKKLSVIVGKDRKI